MSPYGDEEEIVSLLKAADEGFGDDYADRAIVLDVLGDYYQFHRKFDTAEMYLNQAIAYAEISGSMEAKRNLFSAFHAMYFNAGEYEKSAENLRQFMQASMPEMDEGLLMYYYNGMGNIYHKLGSDSANYYYGQLEELMNHADQYGGQTAGKAKEKDGIRRIILGLFPINVWNGMIVT